MNTIKKHLSFFRYQPINLEVTRIDYIIFLMSRGNVNFMGNILEWTQLNFMNTLLKIKQLVKFPIVLT